MTDPWKVLGVDPGSSEEEVKAAYKKLARTQHPDVSVEPDAEQRWHELSEAYQAVLARGPKQLKQPDGWTWTKTSRSSTWAGVSSSSSPSSRNTYNLLL